MYQLSPEKYIDRKLTNEQCKEIAPVLNELANSTNGQNGLLTFLTINAYRTATDEPITEDKQKRLQAQLFNVILYGYLHTDVDLSLIRRLENIWYGEDEVSMYVQMQKSLAGAIPEDIDDKAKNSTISNTLDYLKKYPVTWVDYTKLGRPIEEHTLEDTLSALGWRMYAVTKVHEDKNGKQDKQAENIYFEHKDGMIANGGSTITSALNAAKMCLTLRVKNSQGTLTLGSYDIYLGHTKK